MPPPAPSLSRWPAVTFRARLVLAATAAVLVVVVLGSIATYIVAYNSLVGSVDVTLSAEAQPAIDAIASTNVPRCIANGCPTAGHLLPGGATPAARPTPSDPRSSRCPPRSGPRPPARARRRTATSPPPSNGIAVREIVVALPPGFVYRGNNGGLRQVPAGGGALQVTAPLTGVNQELRHLALALWLIVLVGVALAVLLGLGVGRTVLRPAQQPDRHGRGAGRDHRRLRASRPGRPRRARPAATGLQPAAGRPSTPRGRASASWCSTPPTSCARR